MSDVEDEEEYIVHIRSKNSDSGRGVVTVIQDVPPKYDLMR
jgi:translation initiation factor 1 (eIF-1/SUI1)